jgi:hypothetical protein
LKIQGKRQNKLYDQEKMELYSSPTKTMHSSFESILSGKNSKMGR